MTFDEFYNEWVSEPEDVVCHTSGSTGTPHLIHLPKQRMIESAERTCRHFGINSSSHLHSCISADYIGGKMMMVRSRVSGASFSWEIPSNTPLKDFVGPPIDLVSVVPSQMLFLLDNPEIMARAKNYLIGGAAIPSSLRKRSLDSGISAYESYGMTETSSHIAIRKVEEGNEWFETLPGISVSLDDDSRLCIHIENWKSFYTNDIAQLKSSTSFRILGRADNVINTGGKKVYPEEVEKILSEYFTFPFYISYRNDEKWGQRIILIAENPTVSDDEIISLCKLHLESFKCPKEVVGLSHFSYTPNGKIKRIPIK
ncbi:MAG: AMP-binding protein [Muribaculaceae bacterium]|nr:AMP-binding protein [Muribaculaceae bacterium]